jgi:hypothetical protein
MGKFAWVLSRWHPFMPATDAPDSCVAFGAIMERIDGRKPMRCYEEGYERIGAEVQRVEIG